MNKLLSVMYLLLAPMVAMASPEVFEASGENADEIQQTVEDFRTRLGDLNPNVAGSFGDGRREINWDGVPDSAADPNAFPPDFFNNTSPRGVVLFTPGSKLLVSANEDNPTHTRVEFGDISRIFPKQFATFSPQRLFSALDSEIIEVLFFEPGNPNPATTSGFGAVFTDVDRKNRTRIEYLDINGNVLFSQSVLPGPKRRESLSFLGVAFDEGEQVFMVRLTNGDRTLIQKGIKVDTVVMDDFIYAEPIPINEVR